MSPRRTGAALSFLLMLVHAYGARPALAQESRDRAAAAQALFDAAVELMERGDYAQACPKLAESQKLDPGAGTLLNLATCYEKNGQTASAWVTYEEAATLAGKRGRKDWVTLAQERASALEPRLSRITVSVSPENRVEGLKVRRGDLPVEEGMWGIAIPADPGDHEIVAEAPGRVPWSQRITLAAEGAHVTVEIPLLEEAPAPEPPPEVPRVVPSVPAERPVATYWSTQRILGVTTAGVGVVGMTIGAIFGLEAKRTYDDAKSFCPGGGTACTAEGIALADDAKGAATVSTVSFIAGGALVAAGAGLFFLAPSSDSARGPASVRVTPSAGAGALGLRVGGTW